MKYDSSIVGEKVINAAGKDGTIVSVSRSARKMRENRKRGTQGAGAKTQGVGRKNAGRGARKRKARARGTQGAKTQGASCEKPRAAAFRQRN